MSDRLWITDFKYDDGAMLVKKTGHRIPITLSLAHDIFTWFCFYFFCPDMANMAPYHWP